MELKRRSNLIYALLFAVWVLVVFWQMNEHARVEDGGRMFMRRNSRAIANTLGAFVRGLQFRGAVFRDRLEPVLNELVTGSTNEFTKAGELISIELLNAAGEPVAFAGKPVDPELKNILTEGERWGMRSVTMVYPLEGASLTPEGGTNTQAPLLLEPRTNGPRGFPRREFRPPGAMDSNAVSTLDTNALARIENENPPPPPPDRGPGPGGPGFDPGERRGPPPGEGEPRPRRPFWARGLNDTEYQAMIQKRELHGLVLTLST